MDDMMDKSLRAVAMLDALMMSASKDGSIISVYETAHVSIANALVERGYLKSFPENCTTNPAERCYSITEAGIKYINELPQKK